MNPVFFAAASSAQHVQSNGGFDMSNEQAAWCGVALLVFFLVVKLISRPRFRK